jgi:hypothetical protein
VHDPETLSHPRLRPYWPSERRAILAYRRTLAQREQREVSVEEAVERWEPGPSRLWRAKKAALDSAIQHNEIERHKYFLSQQKGYDVGEETAALDWVKNYARAWRTWWEEQPESAGNISDIL